MNFVTWGLIFCQDTHLSQKPIYIGVSLVEFVGNLAMTYGKGYLDFVLLRIP
jgi:hypothetical protein